MPGLVDWTVDRLFSEAENINRRQAAERSRLAGLRSRYNAELRALPTITNPDVKAATKVALTSFIREQLTAEDKLRDFDEKWAAFKALARRVLGGAGVTVPPYLNAAPIVIAPAAVIVAFVAAAAVIGTIAALTNNLDAKMKAIEYARAHGVDPNDILDSDLVKALKAAMPLVLALSAAYLAPKILGAIPKRGSA